MRGIHLIWPITAAVGMRLANCAEKRHNKFRNFGKKALKKNTVITDFEVHC